MTGIELLVLLRENRVEQRAVTEKLGLTPPQISNYVRDVTPISPERERQIREAVAAIVAEGGTRRPPARVRRRQRTETEAGGTA